MKMWVNEEEIPACYCKKCDLVFPTHEETIRFGDRVVKFSRCPKCGEGIVTSGVLPVSPTKIKVRTKKEKKKLTDKQKEFMVQEFFARHPKIEARSERFILQRIFGSDSTHMYETLRRYEGKFYTKEEVGNTFGKGKLYNWKSLVAEVPNKQKNGAKEFRKYWKDLID